MKTANVFVFSYCHYSFYIFFLSSSLRGFRFDFVAILPFLLLLVLLLLLLLLVYVFNSISVSISVFICSLYFSHQIAFGFYLEQSYKLLKYCRKVAFSGSFAFLFSLLIKKNKKHKRNQKNTFF